MSSVQEARLDLEELLSLSNSAVRPNVKHFLSCEIQRLQTDILKKEQAATEKTSSVKTTGVGSHAIEVKLVNYAWDQSDKFVKIYVAVSGVHNIPADCVITNFTPKSMELRINGLENKNYSLVINNLSHNIDDKESHHKVKTDKVIVFLRKSGTTNWNCITAAESKAIESKTPKLDDEDGGDPGKSLMNLMKKMYDEGDDEMKRTIAKAWAEARDKQSQGDNLF